MYGPGETVCAGWTKLGLDEALYEPNDAWATVGL